MRETGLEVSVLRTPSKVALLTAWLSRSLKLNMIAQSELELWLLVHEIIYYFLLHAFFARSPRDTLELVGQILIKRNIRY